MKVTVCAVLFVAVDDAPRLSAAPGGVARESSVA
jgi:hypothetical protein